MAWNGKNVSILGERRSAETKDERPSATTAFPSTKEGEDATAAIAASAVEGRRAAGDASAAASEPKRASPPPPSVWNGSHQKIIGTVKTPPVPPPSPASVAVSVVPPEPHHAPRVLPPPSDASSVTAGSSNPASASYASATSPRAPSPCAVSSTTSFSAASKNQRQQREEHLTVVDTKSVHQHDLDKGANKGDETTNSTAGSSTTNTTIEEQQQDHSAAESESASRTTMEVNVVNTEVVATLKKQQQQQDAANEKKKEGKSRGSSGSGGAKHQKGEGGKGGGNKAAGGNNKGNHPKRSGNNNKGTRGNNSSSSGNANGKNNFAKGNGRRKTGPNHVGARKICMFYAQGLCNRGSACTYKHEDPTSKRQSAAAAAQTSPPAAVPPASFQRSGTYPPAAGAHNKRVYDPFKAQAIALAKAAQDREDRSSFASTSKIIQKGAEGGAAEATAKATATDDEAKRRESEDPPIFSIDVECIATGRGSCAKGINDGCGNERRGAEGVPAGMYNDRSQRYPGRVSMVDSDLNVLADIVVRPPHDGRGVVSYLTPLTGLTAEACLGDDAKSLEEAVDVIKGLLPANGILVGQAIDHDIEWLGLTPGKDFDRVLDISEIFRQRLPSSLQQAADYLKEKGGETTAGGDNADDADPSSDEHLGFPTRYRHFSLRHVCLNLLGEDIQSGAHDPIVDARYSLVLFHKYRNSSVTQLRIVRDGLHRAPVTPSFVQENSPIMDGVCVSAAAYPYKRAARKVWRWYAAIKAKRAS